MSKLASTTAYSGESTFQAFIPGASQVVAESNSSTQSTTLTFNTSLVRLCSDTGCFVVIGSNPTATTTSMYLPPQIAEYFGVVPGATNKVAVILSTGTGNLYVTEGL